MTGVRGQGGGFADGMTGFLRGGSAWHKKKGRAPCGTSRCFWSGYLRLQNEQVGQGQPRLNAIL